MAGFNFRLQSLLNIRQQIEDSLKNELGKAIRKLEEEKQILRRLEMCEKKSIQELKNRTAMGIMVEKLKEFNLFLSHLRKRISWQKENVNHARNNVDKVREELIKASQEREMIDKLKNKKYNTYLYGLKKKEQRVYDEIVSYKRSSKFTGD